MTQDKPIEVINFIKDVNCSDEQKRLMLEQAANTITIDKLGGLVQSDEQKTSKVKNRRNGLKFTKKEILQMPKELQKYITIKLDIPVRQKPNGVYEARFRAHGFNICTSSTDFDKLKPQLLNKFLHFLHKRNLLHPRYFQKSRGNGLNLNALKLKSRHINFMPSFSEQLFYRF